MRPEYIVGDSRDLISLYESKRLPPPDLVITSPPYYDLKQYARRSGQLGCGQDYDDFLNDTAFVLQECYSVASERSSLWLVVDSFKKNGYLRPLPFDIVGRLENVFGHATWRLRDVIIWDKYKNIPWHQNGHLKNQYEYLLFFSKTDKYTFRIDRLRQIVDYKLWWMTYPERYNPNGMPPGNLWQHCPPLRGWGANDQNHYCSFPFSLVERIVSVASDPRQTVLDPFAGSGTVLAVASAMGRRSVGFDISASYRKRFYEQVLPAAKKYWSARVRSIDESWDKAKRFQKLNLQLRKIKSAFEVKDSISTAFSQKSLFFLLDNAGTSVAELIIVSPTPSELKKRIIRNRLAERSTSKFRVDLHIRVLTLTTFRKRTSTSRKFSEYAQKKIYHRSGEFSLADILKSKANQCIYSNIRLELSKSVDALTL